MTEERLPGGNMTTGVVRVGDTVRRPAGPHTPAVHALLTHLRAVGFDQVPRPLGVDTSGREVLGYIPGEPVFPDRLALLDSDRAIGGIGRMIKDFHDASAGFTPPADAQWNVVIPDVGSDLVVHHDLAPWNLIASDDGPWMLIDWDTAAPGTRLWDLAYAAHGFVPLAADPRSARENPAQRLRVLVDAYGLDESERRRLLHLLPARTRSMYDLLARESAAGMEPWATLWREGHGRTWHDDTTYIVENASLWRRAVIDE